MTVIVVPIIRNDVTENWFAEKPEPESIKCVSPHYFSDVYVKLGESNMCVLLQQPF